MIAGLPADVPGFAAAVARLKAAGVDNPRLDVRVLWAYAENQAALGLGGDAPARFESYLVRRESREPVAYIVGHKEFWGLDFAVGPGILVPRPDTETVVEAVLKAFSDRQAPLNILDLGTGSGCLLAALLQEYPAARGVGLDAAPVACRVAAGNLERLGLAGRGLIRRGNWHDSFPDNAPDSVLGSGIAGMFDVVVSNPPYIPTADIPGLEPDVAEYEPPAALDGGQDGFFAYRTLFARVGAWLTPGGQAFFEIGWGQDRDLILLATSFGLSVMDAVADLAGTVRVLVVKRP